METVFELFGLSGYQLGLAATIGTLILFCAMLLLARQRTVKPASVCVLTIFGMIFGIAGARLLYSLVNLSTFTETYENLWLTLRFFDGGLSMAGMLLGMFAAAAISAAVTGEAAGEMSDLLFVPLGLLLCALYLGQQGSELGVGKIVEQGAVTDALPWLFLCERMGVNVEYRLLVSLYQAIVSLVIAVVMIAIYLRNRRSSGYRSGEMALVSLAVYGAAQVVLESLRDDGHMLIIFLRIGQIVAALLPIVATVVFAGRYAKQKAKGGLPVVLSCAAIVIFIAGIVLLEFSLDGRLAWGTASEARDYAIMAVLCAVMAAVPCLLYRAVLKQRSSASEQAVQ